MNIINNNNNNYQTTKRTKNKYITINADKQQTAHFVSRHRLKTQFTTEQSTLVKTTEYLNTQRVIALLCTNLKYSRFEKKNKQIFGTTPENIGKPTGSKIRSKKNALVATGGRARQSRRTL